MSTRNVSGLPPHHADCVILPPPVDTPVFPLARMRSRYSRRSGYARTKENIPPKGDVQLGLFKKGTAFNKKDYTIQDRSHVQEEDIECDIEEEK